MARPSILQILFLFGHSLIALILVSNLYLHRQERREDVDKLSDLAQDKRADTAHLRQQVKKYSALLEGMSAKDPYVIELLVRDHPGYRHSERREVPPPPLNQSHNE